MKTQIIKSALALFFVGALVSCQDKGTNETSEVSETEIVKEVPMV